MSKAEEFEYKLPEGYTMDVGLRAKLDKLVEKTGLSEEDAQAFVDLHVELMEDYAERAAEANGGTAEYAPENPEPQAVS